jgi:hypothetical protein
MKRFLLHSLLIIFLGAVIVTVLLALITHPVVDLPVSEIQNTATPVMTEVVLATIILPNTATPTLTPTITMTPPVEISLWLSEEVPDLFRERLTLSDNLTLESEKEKADIQLIISPDNTGEMIGQWIFALVAPFPTVADEVKMVDIQAIWSGQDASEDMSKKILVTEETKKILSLKFGDPSLNNIIVVKDSELRDLAWDWRIYYAIIPFEKLDPHWKVMRVDGHSPLEKDFDPISYALTINISVEGRPESISQFKELTRNKSISYLPSNRDPLKMTVVVLTGTTALTRDTAAIMDQKGVEYPAGDILAWLKEADITHISNEVAFAADCPDFVLGKKTYKFCSKLEYFQLLEYIGADIIELTGNHVMDWGKDALLSTLEMYIQANMKYYGGGKNLEDARKAVKIEHNGNKIAFIGCNAAGPASAWATETEPGANPCDRTWLAEELTRLREEGYLPIVTYQHIEQCSTEPHIYHRSDSFFAADSGAVIVSGSQAHCPQKMEFRREVFIHYGLGNLFFDQMDDVTRREFVDRYVFYDGKLISIELLTAMLEDYSRPRPMTIPERRYFLFELFSASGWE